MAMVYKNGRMVYQDDKTGQTTNFGPSQTPSLANQNNYANLMPTGTVGQGSSHSSGPQPSVAGIGPALHIGSASNPAPSGNQTGMAVSPNYMPVQPGQAPSPAQGGVQTMTPEEQHQSGVNFINRVHPGAPLTKDEREQVNPSPWTLAGLQKGEDDALKEYDDTKEGLYKQTYADEALAGRRMSEMNALSGGGMGGAFAGGAAQVALGGEQARLKAGQDFAKNRLELKMAYLDRMMKQAQYEGNIDLQKWVATEQDKTSLAVSQMQADATKYAAEYASED